MKTKFVIELVVVTLLLISFGMAHADQPNPNLPICSILQNAGIRDFYVTGMVTRKGPDRTSYWAITTSSGKEWRLAGFLDAIDPSQFENKSVLAEVQCLGQDISDKVAVENIELKN